MSFSINFPKKIGHIINSTIWTVQIINFILLTDELLNAKYRTVTLASPLVLNTLARFQEIEIRLRLHRSSLCITRVRSGKLLLSLLFSLDPGMPRCLQYIYLDLSGLRWQIDEYIFGVIKISLRIYLFHHLSAKIYKLQQL